MPPRPTHPRHTAWQTPLSPGGRRSKQASSPGYSNAGSEGYNRLAKNRPSESEEHLSRYEFPASQQAWVFDAAGNPVLGVMSEPNTCLVGELRRLLSDLRRAVGDRHRVLVGFDRGGWSPGLFAQMGV